MDKAAMNAIMKMIASKLAATIGGPLTWLWTKVLYYGGQAIYDLVSDGIRKWKRSGVQAEKEKELEKVDKDPKSTSEDKGKAYEEFINSGRK